MNGISAMRIVAMFVASCSKVGMSLVDIPIYKLFITLINLKVRGDESMPYLDNDSMPHLFLLKSKSGDLSWGTYCNDVPPIAIITIKNPGDSPSVLVQIETRDRQVTRLFQWDGESLRLPDQMVLGAIKQCILDNSPISSDISLDSLNFQENHTITGQFDKGTFTIVFEPYLLTITYVLSAHVEQQIMIKYNMVVNYIV